MQLSPSRLFTLLLFLSLSYSLTAQSPQDIWYFGDQQGMRFENGDPVFDGNSKAKYLVGSSTMSDSAGNLLFYTNGRIFFDRNHNEMPGIIGIDGLSVVDVVSIPSTQNSNVYHVYVANTQWLAQYKVDMSKNNGLGTVEHIKSHFTNGPLRGVAALKTCKKNTYWLISVEQLTNTEYSINTLEIDGGTGYPTIKDRFPIGETINRFIWELTASPQADQLAIVSEYDFNVFDFDPICGKISNQTTLPLPVTTAAPLAACYSPDGRYLYASYGTSFGKDSGLLYQLNRYQLTDKDLFENWHATDHVITGMQNGPDDRLYAVANYQADQSATINRLEKPNDLWPIGAYTESVLKLQRDWFYHTSFPNYVVGSPNCKLPEPELQKDFFCEGDSIRLEVKNVSLFDSLHYINRVKHTSIFIDGSTNILLSPKDTGRHLLEMTWNKCLIPKKVEIPIDVLQKPKIRISDTVICVGDSLFVRRNVSGFTQRIDVWTGNVWTPITSDSIITDSGDYRLEVSNQFCAQQKDFEVQWTKPLLTELDDEYTFCDKAGNIVLLDAGKGFTHYKWFPTRDSTQWIEVKNAGNYYVVVKDSKGCSGKGSADVLSDCQPYIFIPNAFSPNGDGLNELFQIETSFTNILNVKIFDRWGSIVYYGDSEEKAWDGTKKGDDLPIGVYLYIVEYENALEGGNAQSASGTLHLVR